MSVKEFQLSAEDSGTQSEKSGVFTIVRKIEKTEKSGFGKRHLIISIVCILLTVLYLASYFLYLAKVIPNRFDENYQKIMALYGSTAEGLPEGANEAFGALYALNSDLAGIVTIDSSTLNYPFVKPVSHTKTYYNSHLFNFVRCDGGTAYTTDGYQISGYNNSTVIYGQNYRSRMFAELSKYDKLEYYQSHPIITLNTLFHNIKYKIFAVSILDGENTYNFEAENYATEETLQEFYKGATDTSLYYTDITVRLGDRICVLVSEYEYGGRVVIAARSLRDDEDSTFANDHIAYKSSGDTPPETENVQDTAGEELPKDSPEDEVAEIVTEEGEIPQNQQNAGAILPSVRDDTPIVTIPVTPQNPSASSAVSTSKPASSTTQSTPSSSTAQSSSVASSSSSKPSSSVSSSSSSSSTSSVTTVGDRYIVTTSDTSLNVREGPGTSYKVVARVTKGSVVNVIRIQDSWAQITAAGSVNGWVSIAYITKEQTSSSASSGTSSVAPTIPAGDLKSPEGYTYYNAAAANEVITVVSSLGNTYTETAYSIICRIVEIEVGSGYPVETIKAQAVAAYSYIMYRVRRGSIPSGVAMKAYSAVGTRVKQCVAATIGQTLVYNGRICDAYYATCTAGKTNDVRDVWSSGTEIPYLTPVDSSIDKNYKNFSYTKTMSAADVISRAKKSFNLDISKAEDKANWFKELDKNRSGVYNGNMSLAGHTTYTTTGGATRNITGQRMYSAFGLRSAAFDVSYNASNDTFTFTTYGWGHGVGMSQVGAYYYVTLNGWNYMQVLLHYYPGAVLRDYA